jgi:hypothetical protein
MLGVDRGSFLWSMWFTTKGGNEKHFSSESCRQNHTQGNTPAHLESPFVTHSENSASALASNRIARITSRCHSGFQLTMTGQRLTALLSDVPAFTRGGVLC